MKRILKVFSALILLMTVVYLLACSSFPFYPDRSICMQNAECLLKTNWQQTGGFEAYAPNSQRLGCWSTALAQIMYYHRLKPVGRVQYTSRQGFKIDQALDDVEFDFDLFMPTMDSNTANETASQLALYNYFAALVVQKDFGTDRYMHKLAPAELLEKHYKVKVQRYIAWRFCLPNTLGKLEKLIYNELRARRPVLLHFANLNDFGHSVVVDGFCYQHGTLMVHTNQGQGGPDDGWYDFYKGILKPDDNALRVLYTFSPL